MNPGAAEVFNCNFSSSFLSLPFKLYLSPLANFNNSSIRFLSFVVSSLSVILSLSFIEDDNFSNIFFALLTAFCANEIFVLSPVFLASSNFFSA